MYVYKVLLKFLAGKVKNIYQYHDVSLPVRSNLSSKLAANPGTFISSFS